MSWFTELLVGHSVGHIVLVFALVISLGMALGRIKICGISLGATFVLLVGIVVSHFGMQFPDLLCVDKNGGKHFVDPEVLHFVREFGLILFVYAVGLQAGPGFFNAFKAGGLKLNLLAAAIVCSAVGITIAIHYITGIEMPTMVGILSGAITNTPGLGAAQQTYAAMNEANDSSILGTAYAMAYPLGVIGIIMSIIAIRLIFRIDMDKENERLRAEHKETQIDTKSADDSEEQGRGHGEPLVPIFLGILLGVVLGSIPVYIPGVPQPVKLGLAGGPLVIAILMGAFGKKIGFPTPVTRSAVLMLREVGICLFLACVGLIAGEKFVETVVNGGLVWVGLGVIITVVPLLVVGTLAYALFKVDYFTIMGMLAGSTTDPPALSYSVGAAGNDRPALGYATVYPLTMFLRIMTAQLLILLFV